MNRTALIFLYSLLSTANCFAQCCSPGNPVGGAGNLGIMEAKSFKVMANYRYSHSGKYYDGSKPTDPYFVKTGYFNYTGIQLAYALNKRVTLELEMGYFVNKTQTFVDGIIPGKKSGYGFTNVTFIPQLNILRKKDWEITTGLGLKYPAGPYDKEFEGAIAELDIQPSTGAVDYIHTIFISKEYLQKHLRYFMLHRTEIKTANPLQYKYGNLYVTSFFMSFSPSFRWDVILQLRSEIRDKDERPGQIKPYNTEKISISGSQKVFITPQINYNISPTFRTSILLDYPIYQYYNEQQLASTFAVSLSISKNFKTKNIK